MTEIKEELKDTEQGHQDDIQLKEIVELETKIKELEENNLRTHADFQNIKKRLEKDKLIAIKHSHENFSFDMLDVLDTLHLAEQHISDENEKKGITNTIQKLESIFEKYNIKETPADEFNPNHHQAVQNVESDKNSGEIVDVLRKGYFIHDKILRPAMVTIAQ